MIEVKVASCNTVLNMVNAEVSVINSKIKELSSLCSLLLNKVSECKSDCPGNDSENYSMLKAECSCNFLNVKPGTVM